MSYKRLADSNAIANWEGGVTYRPNSIVRVTSVEDVVRVLTSPEIYPAPVRAVGTLHSPARCSADDGGTMLDMTGMNRIIEIGEDHVTAEAGAIYIDVADALSRKGLQFHINTEIGNVTLGAAACAATKDSSLTGTSYFGQVSSFVSGMKVVLPDGTVRSYNEDDNPEEMRLLRSSYGLLGVIVEVTMRATAATALEVHHKILTLAEYREQFPEMVRQRYAIMTYMFPFADRIVVELRKENDHPRPGGAWRWELRNSFWRKWAPYFALAIRRTTSNVAVQRGLLRALHWIMRR
ncbi:MAG: FAD-dependent oxidoreductase, partial [Hyphomicrobiales bacterium]